MAAQLGAVRRSTGSHVRPPLPRAGAIARSTSSTATMTTIAARTSRGSKTTSSSWREQRQQKRGLLGQVREHMEVVGNDEEHVGTVDKVAGDRLILTKSDPDSGGAHHSLSCADIERVEGDRVILDCTAGKAQAALARRKPRSRIVRARRPGRDGLRACSTAASRAPTASAVAAEPPERRADPGPAVSPSRPGLSLLARPRVGAFQRRRRKRMARAWHLKSRPHGHADQRQFRAEGRRPSPARRRHGPGPQPLAVGRSLHARPDERREKLRPAVRRSASRWTAARSARSSRAGRGLRPATWSCTWPAGATRQ